MTLIYFLELFLALESVVVLKHQEGRTK